MQIDATKSTMLERASKRWSSFPSAARLYLVGLLIFAAGFALSFFQPKGLAVNWAFTTAMICLGAGFLREGYGWAVLRKDYPLVKLAGGVLTVMAAAVATGGAAITIADATGQDPSNFKSSIALLAPLSFVPILAIVVMLVGFFSLPIILLLSAGKHALKKQGDDGFEALLLIARILGSVALIAGAGQLLSPSTRVDDGLKWIAAYSAYMLDMHTDQNCSTVPGDRITRLNDNLVILGRITDEGPRFARVSCALAPEATVLPPPKSGNPKSSEPPTAPKTGLLVPIPPSRHP